MVQLPLSLPTPGATQIEQLVDGVLGQGGAPRAGHSYLWDASEIAEARERLSGGGGPDTLDGVMGALAAVRGSTDESNSKPLEDAALQLCVAMRFCRVAGGNLTRRPPQIRT
jgi:hypothetical protein